MIRYLIFLISLFFSMVAVAATASSMDLAECGSAADQKLKTLLSSVAFPPDYLQAGMIGRIERLDFKNTTPGSYAQEYLGTYRLTYKDAAYAFFREQEIRVQFSSPFICDSIRVVCLDVLSSIPAKGVDPAVISQSGPLQCKAQSN